MQEINNLAYSGSTHIRFFHPSWIQLKIDTFVIYIDPAYLKTYHSGLADNIIYSSWPDPIDGLPDRTLEKGDLILVTHHHKDHCKQVTVNRLMKAGTRIAAPQSCRPELGTQISCVRPGSRIQCGPVSVHVTDAYNTDEGSSTRKQHKKGNGVGYVIATPGHTIYHAGDTDLIAEMKNLPAIDVAILPIGGTFTMNSQEALEAVRLIQPKAVIPVHHMKADAALFADAVNASAPGKALVLQNGGSIRL